MRSRADNGFTLIEILIVIAIIGIIAAIAIPGMLRARVSANEAAAIQDLRNAMSSYAGRTITCVTLPPGFVGTKSGYVRGCTPGWFWATPEIPGKTGVRGFAGDGEGRLCFTTDGSMPTMPNCTTLK